MSFVVSDGVEKGVPEHEATETAVTAPVQQYAPPTFPEGGRKAWLVVFGAMIVNGCSFGYASSFGVYEAYYQGHQLSHKSPSDIAWIGSIQLFFVFGGGLFAGALFDRIGARKIIIPAGLIYVLAIMLTSLCKEYWQFILAQGILGGFSNGFLFTPSMSCVNHYFQKKRGAALGAVAVGSSIGGVVIPIVLQKCFYSSIGFGWGVRILGFGMLACLTVASLLIKERLPPRKGAFFAPEAFLQPSYVLTVAAIFLIFLAIFLPFFYISTYAIEKMHMSTSLAFYLLSIINGLSLVGRTFFGFIGDKVGFLSLLTGLAIINAIMMFCFSVTTSNAGIIVWAAFFGFTSGGIFAVFPAAVAHSAPQPQLIGTYIGQMMAVTSLAGLTGGPICGALVSSYGYLQASIFAGVVLLAAAVCMAGGRFTKQPDFRQKA